MNYRDPAQITPPKTSKRIPMLKGKVAIVTGSTSGIGLDRAVAKR